MTGDAVRIVAIGDSFSEGVGDEEAGAGGWTKRVAAGLARQQQRAVSYANLAIRGRLLGPILDEQLPAALALAPAPTVVTICGGGNDMLRPKFDVPALAARLGDALERIRAAGAEAVLVSPADPSARLPLGRLIHSRGDRWSSALARLAADLGVPFVDVSRDDTLRQARFWSADRLHMNSLGHLRVANQILDTILRRPVDAEQAMPDAERRTLRTELRYFNDYVVPWIGRRVTGRSSGDGRAAPQPTWAALAPA